MAKTSSALAHSLQLPQGTSFFVMSALTWPATARSQPAPWLAGLAPAAGDTSRGHVCSSRGVAEWCWASVQLVPLAGWPASQQDLRKWRPLEAILVLRGYRWPVLPMHGEWAWEADSELSRQ